METGIPAGLSRGDSRRFGLTLGAAFLGLGAFLWWRHRPIEAQLVAVAIGATLLIAAVAAPRSLGRLERAWGRFGEILSRITTPIIVAVLFYGVIVPIGVLSRPFRRNPLVRQPDSSSSFWVARPNASRKSQLQRQF